jgi:FKBP-type peptidyl-prolyl cis-trans isomerase 2
MCRWNSAGEVRISTTDVKVGNGREIADGCEVVVHYSAAGTIGDLDAGKFSESSFGPGGRPLSVVIGAGELAPGMDAALIGVREGGTRRLEIRRSDSDRTDDPELVLDVFVDVVSEESPAAVSWRHFAEQRTSSS